MDLPARGRTKTERTASAIARRAAAATVGAALVLAACGTGDGAPETRTVRDGSPSGDAAPAVAEPSDAEAPDAASPDALSDEAEAGLDRMAMTDDPSHAGSPGRGRDGGEGDEAPPPTMGVFDQALADIGGCLRDNGAEVGELTVADMLTKAQGDIPADGTLADIFGYFLDTDPTDPVFAAAVDACEDTVYANPGIAAFLPPPR